MPTLRIHRLHRARPWRRRVRHRLWREWTFARAVYRHLRWRFLLLVAILWFVVILIDLPNGSGTYE